MFWTSAAAVDSCLRCDSRWLILAQNAVLKHTPQSLARLGGQTLGIDASESNVRIASMHASADPLFSPSSPSPSCSLGYRNISAEELLKSDEKFDVVCSMEVIEHVDNPATFLVTCAELVKVNPSSLDHSDQC